jgi:DnaJ family protein A protein 2
MKVIPGQGMPSHRHHEPGNLFVKLNVKFPDYIDQSVIPHLEAALPPRDPPATYGKDVMVEEVEMTELDARQQEQAQRSQDAMDEDDDEQPRVQCKF